MELEPLSHRHKDVTAINADTKQQQKYHVQVDTPKQG